MSPKLLHNECPGSVTGHGLADVQGRCPWCSKKIEGAAPRAEAGRVAYRDGCRVPAALRPGLRDRSAGRVRCPGHPWTFADGPGHYSALRSSPAFLTTTRCRRCAPHSRWTVGLMGCTYIV